MKVLNKDGKDGKGNVKDNFSQQLSNAGKAKGGIEAEVPRKVSWDDVYYDEKTVEGLKEVICSLKASELWGKLAYKGMLFYGPPGTGKTLACHLIANELEAGVFTYGSMNITTGEKDWENVFNAARKWSVENDKVAVLYVDELDSVIYSRDEASDQKEVKTIGSFLRQLDGLHETGKQQTDNGGKTKEIVPKVVVIGATNRIDAIDEAARRPGRLDYEVEIGPPDESGRREITKILMKQQELCTLSSETLDFLVGESQGYTGGDLQGILKKSMSKMFYEEFGKNLQKKYGKAWSGSDEFLKIKENLIKSKLELGKKYIEDAIEETTPSGLKGMFFENPEQDFSDVKGYDDIKKTLEVFVVNPLRKFKKQGKGERVDKRIKNSSGVLLYGPAGTGKTYIAKAVAKEAGANLIFVKGPEIFDKFVGNSERYMRQIFKKAKDCAPCVVVFDEIDGLVGTNNVAHTINDSLQKQMNTMIQELKDDGVKVIATTNEPERINKSLLRYDRLGYQIFMGLPDAEARKSMLEYYSEFLPKSGKIDYDKLSEAAGGYSSSDMKQVCVRAKQWIDIQSTEGKEAKLTQSVLEKILKLVKPKNIETEKYEPYIEEFGSESVGDLYGIQA